MLFWLQTKHGGNYNAGLDEEMGAWLKSGVGLRLVKHVSGETATVVLKACTSYDREPMHPNCCKRAENVFELQVNLLELAERYPALATEMLNNSSKAPSMYAGQCDCCADCDKQLKAAL